ncbi:putative DNA-binding domain-containing protein [Agaribacterium sp. ZY112]|uniref:HvfC/BufC family peptide modification chaperone n=1 Tax=Agaribacterium sp. ZY112 TaxID=3233574 RepID=UPI003524877D
MLNTLKVDALSKANQDYKKQLDQCLNELMTSSKNTLTQKPYRNSIYQRNALGARSQTLRNNFPSLCEQLTTEDCTALFHCYSLHYPSKHWDLNLYGNQLSWFIAQQHKGPKANYYNWAELASITAIEYAITQLYYSGLDYKHDEQTNIEKKTTIELDFSSLDYFSALTLETLKIIQQKHKLLHIKIYNYRGGNNNQQSKKDRYSKFQLQQHDFTIELRSIDTPDETA